MNTTLAIRPAPARTAPHAPSTIDTSKASKLPNEFLSFHLGGEEYGIDLLKVQEIRRYESPTRLANLPDFIKGVIDLRGVIVPVVDLRLKLSSGSVDYNGFTVVIVLNLSGRIIGAVVDSVSDVLTLRPDEIKAAPKMNASVDALHIQGIASIDANGQERMLILCDIEALMRSPDMGLYGIESQPQELPPPAEAPQASRSLNTKLCLCPSLRRACASSRYL